MSAQLGGPKATWVGYGSKGVPQLCCSSRWTLDLHLEFRRPRGCLRSSVPIFGLPDLGKFPTLQFGSHPAFRFRLLTQGRWGIPASALSDVAIAVVDQTVCVRLWSLRRRCAPLHGNPPSSVTIGGRFWILLGLCRVGVGHRRRRAVHAGAKNSLNRRLLHPRERSQALGLLRHGASPLGHLCSPNLNRRWVTDMFDWRNRLFSSSVCGSAGRPLCSN